LKAPGIKLLKLKYCEPLSNFGFEFNLRRYTMERAAAAAVRDRAAAADLAMLLAHAVVGRCRLTLSNPR
jgi:hypothetical protein